MAAAAAEPPPRGDIGAGAGVTCCMCGDRGLPHELFRCKLCRVRLQHRYCSELYPRATAYRRCNWCLREPAVQAQAQAQAHAVASKPTTEKRKAAAEDASTSQVEERQRHEAAGCAATRSRRPAGEIGLPVKKQKPYDERSLGAAEVGLPVKKQKSIDGERSPGAAAAAAKGNSGSKKPMQAGKLTRPGGRVKVRRYKLLAEVISC